MKDLNEKKWKRRQKCIRLNMALFWKQNISFGLSFWECKNVEKRRAGEKRKREEEDDEQENIRRKKEGSKRAKVWNLYGIVWIIMVLYRFWMDYYGD